jgi:hypothetical protein
MRILQTVGGSIFSVFGSGDSHVCKTIEMIKMIALTICYISAGKKNTWFLIVGFDSLMCTKLGGIAESLVNRGKLALLHYEPYLNLEGTSVHHERMD